MTIVRNIVLAKRTSDVRRACPYFSLLSRKFKTWTTHADFLHDVFAF